MLSSNNPPLETADGYDGRTWNRIFNHARNPRLGSPSVLCSGANISGGRRALRIQYAAMCSNTSRLLSLPACITARTLHISTDESNSRLLLSILQGVTYPDYPNPTLALNLHEASYNPGSTLFIYSPSFNSPYQQQNHHSSHIMTPESRAHLHPPGQTQGCMSQPPSSFPSTCTSSSSPQPQPTASYRP